MNDVHEIEKIDAGILTGPVRQALRSTTAQILHWEHHPIRYINTETSNLGLYRFNGTAQDVGQERQWSVVLKAVNAPLNDTDQTYWNYHRREILAYEQGLLADLPGGISAPRCLGITKYKDGVCWLWLENVQDAASRAWLLTEYGSVARRLGQFNGAYLGGRPLPDFPWLSRNWIKGWMDAYEGGCRETLELIKTEDFWVQPLMRSAFPYPITGDVLRLRENHETLLATLHRLPQTFCHLDAYRPNFFIQRDPHGVDQVVAVDWVFTGTAAIGEEIANLLAASLIWFEYDAEDVRALDVVIFNNYLEGLHESGWHGDARLVRLGYAASCALRWGVIGIWWMLSLGDPGERTELETQWNRPLTELVPQWARTTTHVLGLAEEAYQLQRNLFT